MCLCNNYACLQVLVNNPLTWQSGCVIANNARKTVKATGKIMKAWDCRHNVYQLYSL